MQSWSDDPLEQKAWLAIGRLPRVGAVTFQKLLQLGIPLQQLFSFSTEQITSLGLSKQASNLLNSISLSQLDSPAPSFPLLEGVAKDLLWSQGSDRYIISFYDPLYPPLLKEIHDPPPYLFVAGNPYSLSAPQLAVIGSRNPSQAGLSNARSFSSFLAQQGLGITSGLAAGIDGEAHQAALDAKGFTLAVAGHGLDHLYPRQHLNLARGICQSGAVISEYPIGTKPRPQLFPRRNRIISGLAYGVLVVEAALKSGSLITARMALEQGREVFAIPGSIHNPQCRGCHSLIKQGAKLVENGEDIFQELQGFVALSEAPGKDVTVYSSSDYRQPELPVQQSMTEEYDTPEHRLLTFIDYDPIPLDIIVERSGLSASEVASLLVLLELQGLVVQEAGGYCRMQ